MLFRSVLFEIYFPAFVIVKKSRPWVLMIGVCFHFGIALLVAIWGFSFIMMAPYVLFLGSLEGISGANFASRIKAALT